MYHYVVCLLLFIIPDLGARVVFQDQEDERQLYEDFKREYNKSFSGDEDERRFVIFKDNLAQAEVYQKMEEGTAEYGVTQFFDLTPEEFKELYSTARYASNTLSSSEAIKVEQMGQLPDFFDWRDVGAVGPVMDQGRCGSCWAFSAVGNIEGLWYRKIHHLLSLSAQELVDCDRISRGCGGGSPFNAFEATTQLGGLELDADYPYVSRQGQCQLDQSRLVVSINGSVVLPKDEDQIAEYLYTHGPLSVGINSAPLQYYTSGILHISPDHCNPTEVNQAVLAVGFGTEQGVPYWIIKNSWGTLWGEQGYFRLFRGNGTCGVNEAACSALVR